MDKIYLKDLEPTSVPESQIHHHNDQESQNQPTNNLTPKSDGNPIDSMINETHKWSHIFQD